MATRSNSSSASKLFRAGSLLQLLACLGLLLICSMILHKGFADITALALKHGDAGFWQALGRYLIGNLAGG